MLNVQSKNYAGNPLGVSGNYERISFAPYFIFKDLITIFAFIFVLSLFVFFMPNVLGDSENYVVSLQTNYFFSFTFYNYIISSYIILHILKLYTSRVRIQPNNSRQVTCYKPSSRSLSNSTNNYSISPYFITGFVDAEGSFMLKINKSDKYKAGWKIEPVFTIGLHKKDLSILKEIQAYWGGIGRIIKRGELIRLLMLYLPKSIYL